MASLNFPSSPTNGQQYTFNNVTYYYDATLGAWLTTLVTSPLLFPSISNTQVYFSDATGPNGNFGLTFDKGSNTTITSKLVLGNTTTWSANVSLDAGSKTDAIMIPSGNTNQRPTTTANGMIRYNTTLNTFEGYKSGFWGTIGGGATGGGTNDIFYENSTNVTSSYTITSGKNAVSAGPITVNDGVIVTVPSGSVWTIV